MGTATARTWLMLLHQLPPNPPALRVRVWRRLQALGACQLKPSVYLLPDSDEAREDFAWLAREIRADQAEATIWEARAFDGLSDADLIARFQDLAAAEYDELAAEIQSGSAPNSERESERAAKQFQNRFEQIHRRDFFGAPRREVVGGLLAELNQSQDKEIDMATQVKVATPAEIAGKVWVTRAKVKVDRMSSAWLIRRFLDASAEFRFVSETSYRPAPNELRFDMFEGEFSHRGDRCTFETLIDEFDLKRPGLLAIAEIIHDLDLKDGRYGRPETAGVGAILAGIAGRIDQDPERIKAAAPIFDSLLEKFESTA